MLSVIIISAAVTERASPINFREPDAAAAGLSPRRRARARGRAAGPTLNLPLGARAGLAAVIIVATVNAVTEPECPEPGASGSEHGLPVWCCHSDGPVCPGTDDSDAGSH